MGTHPVVSREMALGRLVGEELAAVHFVRDYVELSFDGPTLRIFSGPTVVLDDASASFPESGSRDLLCDLIGRTVQSAGERGGALVLQFDRGGELSVPLWDESDVAEVAALIPARTGRESTYEPTTYWENAKPGPR